jgi:hypothetical protein
MKNILTIIILILTLQSCVIYNSTKQLESNMCSVHNMKKAIVGTTYGLDCDNGNKDEFYNAKLQNLWAV